jgi:hypothetical protein
VRWEEVFEHHRSFKGVYIREGRVVSVLAGSTSHPDLLDGDTVNYSMPDSHGYGWMRNCMENAIADGIQVTVFSKLKKNEWVNLGLHTVISVDRAANEWVFCLKKTQ